MYFHYMIQVYTIENTDGSILLYNSCKDPKLKEDLQSA